MKRVQSGHFVWCNDMNSTPKWPLVEETRLSCWTSNAHGRPDTGEKYNKVVMVQGQRRKVTEAMMTTIEFHGA
jgi:hypothetical protein